MTIHEHGTERQGRGRHLLQRWGYRCGDAKRRLLVYLIQRSVRPRPAGGGVHLLSAIMGYSLVAVEPGR
jgi:hypothetical protein